MAEGLSVFSGDLFWLVWLVLVHFRKDVLARLPLNVIKFINLDDRNSDTQSFLLVGRRQGICSLRRAGQIGTRVRKGFLSPR